MKNVVTGYNKPTVTDFVMIEFCFLISNTQTYKIGQG